jgi:hypothetical protein
LQLANFEEGEKIRVTDMVRRNHVFIEMPPVHTKRYQQAVHFKMEPIDTFVKGTRAERGDRITEFGSYAGVIAGSDVRIAVPEGVMKLRGYVQRIASGFQFVNTVQAGVIPPPVGASAHTAGPL